MRYSIREGKSGEFEVYCTYSDKRICSRRSRTLALLELAKYNMLPETFDAYEREAHFTAKYPDVGSNLNYCLLGLGGETGEVLDKYKKVIRDHSGVLTPEVREAMKAELGDVLWYLNETALTLGSSLEEIAQMNIEKLHSRLKRDKIHGSGDDR